MNAFREAKQILAKKDAGEEITWEEFQKVHTACIALDFMPDLPIGEGLESLARILESLPEPTKSKITGFEIKNNS